jgi:DNA-binding response OmpR family regulator
MGLTDTRRVRILVVDDEETIRKYITTALEEKGYLADTAEDGRAAIRKSEKRVYNLALVDIRLPDMDGVQLLTALKETAPKTVKIIITGYPSLQNAVDAVNKGADGYIVKPIKMGELLVMMEEQLRKQQEEAKYTEQKVVEFIETRARELENR